MHRSSDRVIESKYMCVCHFTIVLIHLIKKCIKRYQPFLMPNSSNLPRCSVAQTLLYWATRHLEQLVELY